MLQTSVHSSWGPLLDLIPWIYHFHYIVIRNPSDFPYFPQFKSEFFNKEFMIWASVSSQSCFHWLYRASASLAAKNIINLISVLTIWWCPCVESSFVLLEEGVCYDQCILLQNCVSLCPMSFCIPRTNLSVTPGVSWLPTFAFQAAMMKVKVLEGLGLSLWFSNAGDLGSIPGLERSHGVGKVYPLQYPGLENSMDCIVYGVAKSQIWLSDFQFH